MAEGQMDVHYSSKEYTWETPPEFFELLDREFSFQLDPCALPDTAKCEKFYTPEQDGLQQDWTPGPVFMNPPYGREISDWMAKAYQESRKGAVVVCLVPARTDTDWWQDYAMRAEEIRLVRRRLSFLQDSQLVDPAPFPSAVVIFRPDSGGPPIFSCLEQPRGQEQLPGIANHFEELRQGRLLAHLRTLAGLLDRAALQQLRGLVESRLASLE